MSGKRWKICGFPLRGVNGGSLFVLPCGKPPPSSEGDKGAAVRCGLLDQSELEREGQDPPLQSSCQNKQTDKFQFIVLVVFILVGGGALDAPKKHLQNLEKRDVQGGAMGAPPGADTATGASGSGRQLTQPLYRQGRCRAPQRDPSPTNCVIRACASNQNLTVHFILNS